MNARLIYASRTGGKPLNIGANAAKRVARSADRRDQLSVQQNLGFGLPRQHQHHQNLVRNRHAYYGDVYANYWGAKQREYDHAAEHAARAFPLTSEGSVIGDPATDDAGVPDGAYPSADS